MLAGASPKDGQIDPAHRVQRHSFAPVGAGILPVSGNSKARGNVPPRVHPRQRCMEPGRSHEMVAG